MSFFETPCSSEEVCNFNLIIGSKSALDAAAGVEISAAAAATPHVTPIVDSSVHAPSEHFAQPFPTIRYERTHQDWFTFYSGSSLASSDSIVTGGLDYSYSSICIWHIIALIDIKTLQFWTVCLIFVVPVLKMIEYSDLTKILVVHLFFS